MTLYYNTNLLYILVKKFTAFPRYATVWWLLEREKRERERERQTDREEFACLQIACLMRERERERCAFAFACLQLHLHDAKRCPIVFEQRC